LISGIVASTCGGLAIACIVPGARPLVRIAAALVVAVGGLLLPVELLLIVLAAPFGLDMAILAPWFRFIAVATPPGQFIVVEPEPVSDCSIVSPLHHSEPYDDPEVIREIGTWIGKQVAR